MWNLDNIEFLSISEPAFFSPGKVNNKAVF